MNLVNLKLTNFRNHASLEVPFTQKTTVFIGSNAAGKTNILEAIYFLSTGKSFKAEYDRDVINHKADYCRIEGRISDNSGLTELEVFIQKSETYENAAIKKVRINKVPKTLQKFVGNFNSVLFSPEDMEIIIGSPAVRRKFLDNILYQVEPSYKRTHSEYILAVKQRNKVLEKIRDFGRGTDELGFWNTKIVHNGILIQEQRKILLNYLSEKLGNYGIDLNGLDTDLKLNYLINEINFERLHEYQPKEIAAKSTLIGPHRDDIEITINGFKISEFGSRGQQRSAILALKLGEVDYISDKRNERPVLLLDDVFSELDEKHEEALMEVINMQQTIITTTEAHEAISKTPADIKHISGY